MSILVNKQKLLQAINSDLISRLSNMIHKKAALKNQLAIAQGRVAVCSRDTTQALPSKMLHIGVLSLGPWKL